MVTVHVYRAEEGGFWAEMPEYPGCYTQGETMDELKENVREAALCYIDDRYADQRTTDLRIGLQARLMKDAGITEADL